MLILLMTAPLFHLVEWSWLTANANYLSWKWQSWSLKTPAIAIFFLNFTSMLWKTNMLISEQVLVLIIQGLVLLVACWVMILTSQCLCVSCMNVNVNMLCSVMHKWCYVNPQILFPTDVIKDSTSKNIKVKDTELLHY